MTSRLNERESGYNLMLSAIFRWFNRSDSFFFGKTSNGYPAKWRLRNERPETDDMSLPWYG